MLGRWYEKLNEWENALEAYMADPEPLSDEMIGHQMRCLESLGRWGELNERARSYSIKIRRSQLWHHVEHGLLDGAMLRAVLAVKSENYDVAVSYIDKYEICMTIRPERQTRIALLWSRRPRGCRHNSEQGQRMLMLRSLVLTQQEMHPLRVKFSSLCRKQGKNVMYRDVPRELLRLDLSAPLHKAVVPNDKPQLVDCESLWIIEQLQSIIVLALCEQLRMDDYRDEAVGKLEALACLKLGEWSEILFQSALSTADNVALSGSQRSLFGESNNDDQSATEQIIRHYARSTEYDKDWHKVVAIAL
ncbi:hypothetical protein DICVIV_13873 [Dictyocaulus viviparus]|uniref:PIK-related kinase FAT domain-containing protein n=1 Tax=Dictyocaulus viviparus TaxID=29172 RepID=A0A0D8XCP0_DICVI|nr:hypothetical protein DICVIV_13873 [Dictyocaulus viviparus]